MKELISPAQANAIFGVALPALGVLLSGAALAIKKERRLALILGGPLVLAGLLWWVYSAITNALGLDTVLNLLVNFALFLAIGIGLGLAWRRFTPSPDAPLPPGLGELGGGDSPIIGGQGVISGGEGKA